MTKKTNKQLYMCLVSESCLALCTKYPYHAYSEISLCNWLNFDFMTALNFSAAFLRLKIYVTLKFPSLAWFLNQTMITLKIIKPQIHDMLPATKLLSDGILEKSRLGEASD